MSSTKSHPIFFTKYKINIYTVEALNIVRQQKVAVFISDNKMPIVKGVDLLNAVRKLSPDTIRDFRNGIRNILPNSLLPSV